MLASLQKRSHLVERCPPRARGTSPGGFAECRECPVDNPLTLITVNSGSPAWPCSSSTTWSTKSTPMRTATASGSSAKRPSRSGGGCPFGSSTRWSRAYRAFAGLPGTSSCGERNGDENHGRDVARWRPMGVRASLARSTRAVRGVRGFLVDRGPADMLYASQISGLREDEGGRRVRLGGFAYSPSMTVRSVTPAFPGERGL